MIKIILIAPEFQNLNKVILEALKKKYQVTFIRDRLSDNSFYKAFVRLKPIFFSFLYRFYLYHKLKKNDQYDYLFVINGEDLTASTIQQIKLKYKIKKSYLYLWDSLKQKKNAKNIIKKFDFAFSYQNEKDRKLIHLDLFYLSQKQTIANKFKFFFVGTIYTNREQLVSEIIKNFNIKDNYIYYFFQAKWYYWLKKITGQTKLNYKKVNFKNLTLSSFLKNLSQSEVIIDIYHFNNKGISQRGIEALNLNKKIITNNPELKKYSKNIYLFKQEINQDQLIKFLNQETYKKQYKGLNIDEWINEILSHQ